MKIILSRKGFDSANGGIVSPIFEDGQMTSFPIPSDDADTYDELFFNGKSYSQILAELRYAGSKHCHVDPDLDPVRRGEQIEGWVPAFGQINSSASYLNNIGVKEGDIFLFFGNFHHVKKDANGVYRYVKGTGDFYKDADLQVIWGYLQIGERLDTVEKQKRIRWHPHAIDSRTGNNTNMIFTASDKLCFDETKPGAGLLKFDKKRVLTLVGSSKATWKKNDVYDLPNVYAVRKNSAKNPTTGIYYAGIWQELGLKESEHCIEWAKSIIL